jgi:hypothetical protein
VMLAHATRWRKAEYQAAIMIDSSETPMAFRGARWVRAYNPRMGTVRTGPVLTLVFVGAMFVLIGLVPWRTAQQNAKSKDDIYKMPKPLK